MKRIAWLNKQTFLSPAVPLVEQFLNDPLKHSLFRLGLGLRLSFRPPLRRNSYFWNLGTVCHMKHGEVLALIAEPRHSMINYLETGQTSGLPLDLDFCY